MSDSSHLNAADDDKTINNIARNDFDHALRQGFWQSVKAWLNKRSNDLLPFDAIRRSIPIRGEHYAGVQEVPLQKIVGSVGRYRDFDRAFLPRHPEIAPRWMSIDRAHLKDVILPPIELFQVGGVYFVKDGNHRVSVAREKGQVFIDAVVTVLDVDVEIDENTDIESLVLKHEQAQFYKRTSLKEYAPEVKIEVTIPEAFSILDEHISTHRYFMGQNLQREVTYEEAAASWFDEVYCPLVYVIRENHVLETFPGRTEADLYVWIIEHLWYLKEEYQKDVSMEEAAEHFIEEYSPRPLRWLFNRFRTEPRELEKKSGEPTATPDAEDERKEDPEH